MKIRIMGTKEECMIATAYYLSLRKDANILSVEVSGLYANRAPSLLYRLYVEVIYKSSDAAINTKLIENNYKQK